MIAIVPKDADSQSSLHKALDDYKHPFPAVLYAGCYQVQATVLANSPLGWSNMDSFQPLADAQIDCLLPGAKLTNWQVPWLLLNGETVQGDGRGSA